VSSSFPLSFILHSSTFNSPLLFNPIGQRELSKEVVVNETHPLNYNALLEAIDSDSKSQLFYKYFFPSSPVLLLPMSFIQTVGDGYFAASSRRVPGCTVATLTAPVQQLLIIYMVFKGIFPYLEAFDPDRPIFLKKVFIPDGDLFGSLNLLFDVATLRKSSPVRS